jgi:hypothetical protein
MTAAFWLPARRIRGRDGQHELLPAVIVGDAGTIAQSTVYVRLYATIYCRHPWDSSKSGGKLTRFSAGRLSIRAINTWPRFPATHEL